MLKLIYIFIFHKCFESQVPTVHDYDSQDFKMIMCFVYTQCGVIHYEAWKIFAIFDNQNSI